MNKEHLEIIGDNHVSSNVETPLLENAFDKSDEEKINSIQISNIIFNKFNTFVSRQILTKP